MSLTRLNYYLVGGRPPLGALTYPGCRDVSPPARTEPVTLPGQLYFALEARAWTGGMAFYDPDGPGRVAARGYLLRGSQFADIAAQEMGQEPGTDLDISLAVASGRHAVGPGHYQTLVCLGDRDGVPMVTFTAPWGAAEVAHRKPSVTYLRLIAAGLREAHGWSWKAISEYLAEAPGAFGEWASAELLAQFEDLSNVADGRLVGAQRAS